MQWLGIKDLNLFKAGQSRLCYHYTNPQKMVVGDGYAPSSFDYQSKALAIELHDHTLAESDGNAPSLSGSKPPVLLLYDDSIEITTNLDQIVQL